MELTRIIGHPVSRCKLFNRFNSRLKVSETSEVGPTLPIRCSALVRDTRHKRLEMMGEAFRRIGENGSEMTLAASQNRPFIPLPECCHAGGHRRFWLITQQATGFVDIRARGDHIGVRNWCGDKMGFAAGLVFDEMDEIA